MKRVLLAAGLLTALLPFGAFAQDGMGPIASQLTAREYLANGYQVVAITLVTNDVIRRAGANMAEDAVLVTMQNQGGIVTCYTTFQSYINGEFMGLGCSEFK